jgi:putative lipoprotein
MYRALWQERRSMIARSLAPFAVLVILATGNDARADGDEWLGRDKAIHFDLSLAMASGAYGLTSLKLDPMWQRAAVGAGFALAMGAGKELVDLAGSGDPSWKDFAWDAIGVAVGVGIALAIDALTRGAEAGPAPATRATAGGLQIRF